MDDLYIHGIPSALPEPEAALLRTRLLRAVTEARTESGEADIGILISSAQTPPAKATPGSGDEPNIHERAARYRASTPLWRLEQLVAPAALHEELATAIDLVRLEPLVFDVWGLREIEPFPRSALNFHGPPGTGKTLAAHAVADRLGKPLLAASYADIESKFHGDGPKNVEALFHAAQRDGAVLFLDEADSLLSKRLTNVTQGSEQAINSMRSQILICLERHQGVVIFATNLVSNYDEAFETRVRHLYFPLPDQTAREAIWQRHLPERLPLADDVSAEALADATDGFCGRDIKNAVVDAALQVARGGRERLALADFLTAITRLKTARDQVRSVPVIGLEPAEQERVEGKLAAALAVPPSGAAVPMVVKEAP
jgi:SpoVK/Ycf46/Vps4 family AAA+-type ATPase